MIYGGINLYLAVKIDEYFKRVIYWWIYRLRKWCLDGDIEVRMDGKI